MRCKIVGLMAAVLLIAGCATEPETTQPGAGAAGAGAGAGTAGMPAPGSVEEFVQEVGDRVFFDFDRHDLTPEARQTLDRQAAWLEEYPSTRVQIEGHADERGTRSYNLALGERRATAVRNYLVALGVAPTRIQTISYGKERPAVVGSGEYAWSQNRRGVTVITDGAPMG